MTLPHTFVPATVASASEVNANFNHLSGIIGSDSTTDEMKPSGDLVLGPQDTVQITAKGSNAAYGSSNYFQIGWNANLKDNNSNQFNDRVLSDKGATAFVMSEKGLEVKSTARSDSSLNELLSSTSAKAMGIHPYYSNGTSTPYVYLNPDWKLHWKDNATNMNSSHDSTRTTLVFLDPAIPIIGTAQVPDYSTGWTTLANTAYTFGGSTTKRHTIDLSTIPDFGRIPSNPVALLLCVNATWAISTGGENNIRKANQHMLRISASDDATDSYVKSTGFMVSSMYTEDSFSGGGVINARRCYSLQQGIVRLGSNSLGRKLFISGVKTILAAPNDSSGATDANWGVEVMIQGVFI